MGPKRAPERRCAACRLRRPKEDLLRFVRTPAGVVFDAEQVVPGRGGYCCPAQACVEKALRRGGLARTLRTTVGSEAAAELAARAVEYLRVSPQEKSQPVSAEGLRSPERSVWEEG